MSIFEYPFLIKELNKYLNNKDKINLIETCKSIYNLKFNLRFNEIVFLYDIVDFWGYDLFTYVTVKDYFILPKNLEILEISPYYNHLNKLGIFNPRTGNLLNGDARIDEKWLPFSLTHLTTPNYYIKKYIRENIHVMSSGYIAGNSNCEICDQYLW